MVYTMRIKVGEAEPLDLRYQEEPGNEENEENEGILISKLAAFVLLSGQWMWAESLYCRSQNRAIPLS